MKLLPESGFSLSDPLLWSGLLSLAVSTAVFLWFIVPHLIRLREVRKLSACCREQKVIALTFDDGPHPEMTSRVADFLKEKGIRASFFVLGNSARTHAGVVQHLLEAGHDVGHHSVDHLNAWKVMPSRYRKDVEDGARIAGELGGRQTLFRPPFGKLTLAGRRLVRKNGWRISWWTVDPRDSLETPRPQHEVLQEVVKAGGGVILLHDAMHYPDPDHADYVMTLLEGLVQVAAENEMTFLPVSELP